MTAIIERLAVDFRAFAPELVASPKVSIYRIYRDTRFSDNKTPYKTHVAAVFPTRGLPKHEGAGTLLPRLARRGLGRRRHVLAAAAAAVRGPRAHRRPTSSSCARSSSRPASASSSARSRANAAARAARVSQGPSGRGVPEVPAVHRRRASFRRRSRPARRSTRPCSPSFARSSPLDPLPQRAAVQRLTMSAALGQETAIADLIVPLHSRRRSRAPDRPETAAPDSRGRPVVQRRAVADRGCRRARTGARHRRHRDQRAADDRIRPSPAEHERQGGRRPRRAPHRLDGHLRRGRPVCRSGREMADPRSHLASRNARRSGDARRRPHARPARRGRRAPAIAARDERRALHRRPAPLLPPLHGALERDRRDRDERTGGDRSGRTAARRAGSISRISRTRRPCGPRCRRPNGGSPITRVCWPRGRPKRRTRPQRSASGHERAGRSRRARHRVERRRTAGAPRRRRDRAAALVARAGRRALGQRSAARRRARRRRCGSTARSCRCWKGRSAARRSRTRSRRRWRRTRAGCIATPGSPTARSARPTSAGSASTCTTSAAAPPRRSAACRPWSRASPRSTCRRRSRR